MSFSLFNYFLNLVSHEFQYICGMLKYIQDRLTAPITVQAARNTRMLSNVDDDDLTINVGNFLNLHCGHNNAFSRDERQSLKSLLDLATKKSK